MQDVLLKCYQAHHNLQSHAQCFTQRNFHNTYHQTSFSLITCSQKLVLC